jgi:hypothetical protein
MPDAFFDACSARHGIGGAPEFTIRSQSFHMGGLSLMRFGKSGSTIRVPFLPKCKVAFS